MEQKPAVQRFMQNRRRQVRFTQDDSSNCQTDPGTEDITKGVDETQWVLKISETLCVQMMRTLIFLFDIKYCVLGYHVLIL